MATDDHDLCAAGRAGVQAARQGYRGELQFPPAGRYLYR